MLATSTCGTLRRRTWIPVVTAMAIAVAGCTSSGRPTAQQTTIATAPTTTAATVASTASPKSTPSLSNIACTPFQLTLEYASEHGPDATTTTFVKSSCVDTWAIGVTGANPLNGAQKLVIFQAESGGRFEWLQYGTFSQGESTAQQTGMPLVTYDYLSSRLAS